MTSYIFFVKNLFRSYLKLWIVFFAIVLFLVSCSKTESSRRFSLEDRAWIEKFLKDVMLDESGIYTLFGSKPLTRFPVFSYSEEEYREAYAAMSEEERKNALVLYSYDLPKNWKKWQQFQALFPSGRYVLFEQTIPDTSKEFMICFADLAKVAVCLEKYYPIFQRVTKQDFNPLQEALFLQEGSPFWDTVFTDSVLVGILYGYGEENSLLFSWKHSASLEIPTHFREMLRFHFSNKKERTMQNLDDFDLPVFASFSDLQDPIIERYKRERNEIQQLYKDKDFVNFTLEKLFANGLN